MAGTRERDSQVIAVARTNATLRVLPGMRGLALGDFRGTELHLELGWLPVLALTVWTLVSYGASPYSAAGWSMTERWLAALLTAALYLGAVLAQEITYLAVAATMGEHPRLLAIYPFGRASRADLPPLSVTQELGVTLLGPGVAALVASVSLVTRNTLVPPDRPLYLVLSQLLQLEVVQMLFRLLPGLPLDGGRLLRLVWWQVGKDFPAAGRAATRSGQTIAFAAMIAGAYYLISAQWTIGLWLTVMGWVLRNAAVGSQAQILVREVLDDITAEQIMDRDFVSIPPDLPVRVLVDHHLPRYHRHAYPVQEDGRLLGLVTTADLARAAPEAWATTAVQAIMTPTSQLVTTPPDVIGSEILQLLAQHDYHQIPVVRDGRLLGMVDHNTVLRYLSWQTEMSLYG